MTKFFFYIILLFLFKDCCTVQQFYPTKLIANYQQRSRRPMTLALVVFVYFNLRHFLHTV